MLKTTFPPSISGPEAEPAWLSAVDTDVMNPLRGRFDTVTCAPVFTGQRCILPALLSTNLLQPILMKSDTGTEDLLNKSALWLIFVSVLTSCLIIEKHLCRNRHDRLNINAEEY